MAVGGATRRGVVAVASQEHRTQKANRDACEARLADLLDKAWDPPKARRQRAGLSEAGKRGRTDGKRRRRDVKANRGRVDYY